MTSRSGNIFSVGSGECGWQMATSRSSPTFFEQLENPEIERGVVIGALNRRGVTTVLELGREAGA